MFRDCGGLRDIRWDVSWSAVFVETVFESSFGAVVALYHVFGVTVNVMSGIGMVSPVDWNLFEVRYVFASETVFSAWV